MVAEKKKRPYRDELIHELSRAKTDLNNARGRFNQATEKELIEQAVFEINALQSRYTYFLRLIKERERELSGAESGLCREAN